MNSDENVGENARICPDLPGYYEGLSTQQLAGLESLLCSPSIQAAADDVGVNERTIRRWLEQPDFRRAYMAARRETMKATTARLQQKTITAVETLDDVQRDHSAPPSSRIAAARTILGIAFRAVEIEDFGERLDNLEEVMRPKEKE